jgi:patatin-like phospholipase/acyl hydrolase
VTEATERADASTDRNPSRDRHLFGPGPKRILALDGGGVRGAITVAFLERMEQLLAEERKRRAALAAPTCSASSRPQGAIQDSGPAQEAQADDKFLLGDWFDLIGGTSTGAVIAGALALGHTTEEIKKFYLQLAPRVFQTSIWRIPGLRAKFDASALRREIDGIVRDRRLDSSDLITGLCVVTKRLDTGSPWILANNPKAKFWNSAAADPSKNERGFTGNRHYRLSNLVRASTAAPHYFNPEVLAIVEDERKEPLADLPAKLAAFPWLALVVSKIRALQIAALKRKTDADTHGMFVDGGVTPYNNPTMALLMMTQLEGFGLQWPLGPENLTIVSIGTGTFRTRLTFKELGFFSPLKVTLSAMLSLMSDAETLALAHMQWLGECPRPWPINSEIGTLANDGPPGRKWFRFLRYDVRLERPWLKEVLGQDYSDSEIIRFRQMDDPGVIETIYGIAKQAAEAQIKLSHLWPDEPSKGGSGTGTRA